MKIQWVTLHVKDMAQAKAFYGDFLGLPCERSMAPGNGLEIAFYKAENDVEIELIHVPQAPYKRIQGVSIGIETREYDALLEKSRAAGLLQGEPQIMGGYLECFFITDPDGMSIMLIRKTDQAE